MQENVNYRDKLIHELIAMRAAEMPQKIALRFGDETLTYSELVTRANQLARYLRSEGVETQSLVGICLNRSLDMVVAILGCLVAGGTYIPIDPAYPRERIRAILADANSKFVVTESGLRDILPIESGKLIFLDEAKPQISGFSKEAPENSAHSEKLAYVIYTSGSTGAPKGVMVSHGSLRNFARISQSGLDVSANDVYLQSATISYALAVRQIMIPLSSGATLVIASREQMHDPLLLFEEMKRTRVTLMDVVPSFWRAMTVRLKDVPESKRRDLLENDLRRIVCVGEALPFDIPREWATATGQRARLVNIFGQTETTGVVATYPLPPISEYKESGIVPIGKSLIETKLYILDEHLNPVPAGETGELCISNPCLANGYLNQPELTAKKFIRNPFQDGLNERLYRTGDLARQREDGVIEFLGRGDSQVKIRGQRLELGEVESVIRKMTGVADCVVLAVKNQLGELYLAAYVVPVNLPIEDTALRRHCKQNLPDYMIPSAILLLEKLPLSPNGKVDRRALAELADKEKPQVASDADLPRDDVEKKLMEIWREFLPQKSMGINDDFIDLGGNSLMAVRLFARIEREFGVRLPLTTFFSAATIAHLANLLRQPIPDSLSDSIIVPVNSGGNKPILFGIHGQEGGVLFWRDIGRYLSKDQPFYAIHAQGVDGNVPALTRIEDMASLYIREMQRIQPRGPYFLCGYSMGGEIAYEMAQQLLADDETVGLLAMMDTRNPERLARLSSYKEMEEKVNAPTRTIPRHVNLWKRIYWQFQHVSGFGATDRVGYFWSLLKTRITRAVIFRIAGFFHKRKLRLPDGLLLTYLRTIHSKSLHEYMPRPYAGKLTLFRATQTENESSDDSPWGWKTLAKGGIEIFRFNAGHNLVYWPHAEEVAQQLEDCLARARGDANLPSSKVSQELLASLSNR